MADAQKRKQGPGDDRDNKFGKKAKESNSFSTSLSHPCHGGAAGKWQTPAQAKKAGKPRRGGQIEVGDQGVWATCMKAKEGKATEELKVLFESMAEKFYGIKPAAEAELDKDSDGEEEDIEAAIAREVEGLTPATKGGKPKLFQPVFLDVQCVLFFKMSKEIDPVDFCKKIAEEAVENPKGRKHRFLNRLSPMSRMGKATEEGLKETARDVLGKVFRLNGQEADAEPREKFSYAIRPTIRNHNQLKRKEIIDTVANLIHDDHKVDLTKPDRTILVEVYQNICGLAVVDNKWDELKRYNLNELYTPTEARRAEAKAADEAGEGAIVEKRDDEPAVNLNIPRRHY